MQRITPLEKDTATDTLEKCPCDAAGRFRTNPWLKPQEYSGPIIGLGILRFAAQRARLAKAGASGRGASRIDDPAAYHAEDILYLPAEARFDYPVNRHGGNANSYYAGPHDTAGCLDFVFRRSGLTQ